MRVAFAGTPEFALPALTALLARHTVVGVLTQPDRPRGRGQKLAASPVKSAALASRVPLAQPQTLKNAAGRAPLLAWRPQVLVVVAYGLILPPEVLTLPPLGCINIHASLLPRWRGAAPIQRAILAGDTETGVTIMQMDSALISTSHTSGSLGDALSTLGTSALLEALDGLVAGTLKASPQPLEGVTYAPKIEKAEARIDWSRDALEIERQIRAFNPWPVAETVLDGEPLRILAAQAGPLAAQPEKSTKSDDHGVIIGVHDDFMRVRCGRGCLHVTRVQRPGRRPVAVRDYSHSVALTGRRLG